MTTSERPRQAFVWVWLPGADEPVVAGRLDESDGVVSFRYGAPTSRAKTASRCRSRSCRYGVDASIRSRS